MLALVCTRLGLSLWAHRPPSMGRMGYGYGAMVTIHGGIGLWIWDGAVAAMVPTYGMPLQGPAQRSPFMGCAPGRGQLPRCGIDTGLVRWPKGHHLWEALRPAFPERPCRRRGRRFPMVQGHHLWDDRGTRNPNGPHLWDAPQALCGPRSPFMGRPWRAKGHRLWDASQAIGHRLWDAEMPLHQRQQLPSPAVEGRMRAGSGLLNGVKRGIKPLFSLKTIVNSPCKPSASSPKP